MFSVQEIPADTIVRFHIRLKTVSKVDNPTPLLCYTWAFLCKRRLSSNFALILIHFRGNGPFSGWVLIFIKCLLCDRNFANSFMYFMTLNFLSENSGWLWVLWQQGTLSVLLMIHPLDLDDHPAHSESLININWILTEQTLTITL